MDASVIISTYNNAPALRRCLQGYAAQTHKNFEIVIADDGSNDSITRLIRQPEFATLQINHAWHADIGFRRAKAMNKAIATAQSDYIIMCDADCIPRNDFVERHLSVRQKRWFISGRNVNIPKHVYEHFTDEEIASNRIFELDYLCQRDPSLKRFSWLLTRNRYFARLMDTVTHRFFALMGCNVGAWREDLLRVNGFDESFTKYSCEDRDLGVRLFNSGCWNKWMKFSLVQIHLDHPRPYMDRAIIKDLKRGVKRRLLTRTTRVEPGLDTALARE